MAFTHIKRHNAEAVEAELFWGRLRTLHHHHHHQFRVIPNLQYIVIPLSLIVSMRFILNAYRRMTTITKKILWPQIVHFVPRRRKKDFEYLHTFILCNKFYIDMKQDWKFQFNSARLILKKLRKLDKIDWTGQKKG